MHFRVLSSPWMKEAHKRSLAAGGSQAPRAAATADAATVPLSRDRDAQIESLLTEQRELVTISSVPHRVVHDAVMQAVHAAGHAEERAEHDRRDVVEQVILCSARGGAGERGTV